MSKTSAKKVSAKSSAKKVVAKKAAPKPQAKTHAVSKTSKQSSNQVLVNKNVLVFLLLTLLLAAIMLVLQAQTNRTQNEQDKAQQALENETSVRYDTKDPKKK